MYQCIASNDYGTVSSSARLYMVDIANPTSPANLSCFDANSTALYLRWEQPNDRNHQPLVAFRIGNNGSAPDMPYVYVVAYHEAGEFLSLPLISSSRVYVRTLFKRAPPHLVPQDFQFQILQVLPDY